MGKNNSTKNQAKKVAARDEWRKQTTETLIKAIEDNPLSWTKEWSAIAGVCNGISGRKYHGINVMHAMSAMLRNGYSDPRFCTYSQAKEKGYVLKDGEKATAILEHWREVRFSKTEQDDDGNEIKVGKSFIRFDSYHRLFNFEQFENTPKWEVVQSNFTADDATRTADELIEKWVCPISESEYEDRAYYSPMRDAINLPSRDSFTSGESFLRTMLHEMTHSTGHKKRLNRDVINSFGTEDYAFEELVAEFGALFTATELGFVAEAMDNTHFANHAGYIQGWLKALKSDIHYVFKAASKASEACDYIMEIINTEELFKVA